MRRAVTVYILMLSLLVNLGVVAAAAYRWLHEAHPAADLAAALALDADQQRRWHALEAPFVRELDAGGREIARHREQLIRAVFADDVDHGRIEAERARIAGLQARQQQRVIAQFLEERAVLRPAQRRALIEILLREAPAAPLEQRMHGG